MGMDNWDVEAGSRADITAVLGSRPTYRGVQILHVPLDHTSMDASTVGLLFAQNVAGTRDGPCAFHSETGM